MKLRLPFILALIAPLLLGAGAYTRTLRPAGAGLLYPTDPNTLRTAIEQYLAEADPIALPGPVVGCVVPHSSLKMCGPILASTLKPIQRGEYDRVIVLSPALFSEFRGCSVPAVQYYQTPLGDIELDGPAIRRITLNSLIDTRAVIYRPGAYTDPEVNRRPLHEREFAAEPALLFLQVLLGNFKLLPIVVGNLDRNLHELSNDDRSKLDEEAIENVARTIDSVMDDRTLLVVCSEFTRFGAVNDFTPFTQNVLQGIAELDMQAFKLVEAKQFNGFEDYLAETGNPITGKFPILIGMHLLPRTSHGVLMGYTLSAKVTGDLSASVSYGGIAFFDATRALHEVAGAALTPPAPALPPSPDQTKGQGTDAGTQ